MSGTAATATMTDGNHQNVVAAASTAGDPSSSAVRAEAALTESAPSAQTAAVAAAMPIDSLASRLFADGLQLIFSFLSSDDWHRTRVWRASKHFYAAARRMKSRGDRLVDCDATRLHSLSASSSPLGHHITRAHILLREAEYLAADSTARRVYYDAFFSALEACDTARWTALEFEFQKEKSFTRREHDSSVYRASVLSDDLRAFRRLASLPRLTHLTFIASNSPDTVSQLWHCLLDASGSVISRLDRLRTLHFLARRSLLHSLPASTLIACPLEEHFLRRLFPPEHTLNSLQHIDLSHTRHPGFYRQLVRRSTQLSLLATMTCPSLTRLDLMQVHPTFLVDLALLPALRHLRIGLYGNEPMSALAPYHAHFAQLETLQLAHPYWRNNRQEHTFADLMRALTRCTSLILEGGLPLDSPAAHEHYVHRSPNDTIDLADLQHAPALTSLTLVHYRHATYEEIIAGLRHCPRIIRLRIGFSRRAPLPPTVPTFAFGSPSSARKKTPTVEYFDPYSSVARFRYEPQARLANAASSSSAVPKPFRWSFAQIDSCRPRCDRSASTTNVSMPLPQLTHFEYRGDLHPFNVAFPDDERERQ